MACRQGLSLQFVQAVQGGVGDILHRHGTGLAAEAPELASKLLTERLERFRSLEADGLIPNQKLYLVLRRGFVKAAKTDRRRLRLWGNDGGYAKLVAVDP